MNKLRRNLFITIFSILTFSILIVILVLNTKTYFEYKDAIQQNLNDVIEVQNDIYTSIRDDEEKDETGAKIAIDEIKDTIHDIKYMDSVVYTVLLKKDNSILDVFNNSTKELTEDEIRSIAEGILSSGNLKEIYIGFLYTKNYSYACQNGVVLVIYDNSDIKASLISNLKISFLVFILLELLVILISKILTKVVIKPVNKSFTMQKQFITDISHELKTPLSVITTSLDILEEFPKEKKWFDNIKVEVNRINNLIFSLLELQTSEIKESYNFERKDLSKIVELSILTLESRAFEKGVKLRYDIDESIIFNFDEESIRHLMEILLDNAISHATKKSNINISLKVHNNDIILKVKNKGEEIPKGEEEKIFERFYRVDKARNRQDNRYGLGLSIAKNIVLNHNGKIEASSSNHTTTFTVTLKSKSI